MRLTNRRLSGYHENERTLSVARVGGGSMLSHEQQGSVAVVTVTDQLDARNSQEAKDFFRSLVERGETRIVVDLSELEFVDSSGLGALVTAIKTARQAGGDVRLCGLTQAVKTIFELTRLTRVFDLYDDRSSAIGSFQPSGS